jgi:hypothetical protein
MAAGESQAVDLCRVLPGKVLSRQTLSACDPDESFTDTVGKVEGDSKRRRPKQENQCETKFCD